MVCIRRLTSLRNTDDGPTVFKALGETLSDSCENFHDLVFHLSYRAREIRVVRDNRSGAYD
jgi:hypothetical protein